MRRKRRRVTWRRRLQLRRARLSRWRWRANYAKARGLLTLPELARAMGMTQRTIQRYVAQGLPVVRVGFNLFVKPKAVKKWLLLPYKL